MILAIIMEGAQVQAIVSDDPDAVGTVVKVIDTDVNGAEWRFRSRVDWEALAGCRTIYVIGHEPA